MEMETVILDYIRKEYVDDDEQELDATTPLITSGIVDSFSMVSLKRFLEKTYGISIPDKDASPETFNTVSNIVKIVRKHQGGV